MLRAQTLGMIQRKRSPRGDVTDPGRPAIAELRKGRGWKWTAEFPLRPEITLVPDMD
jgi:hypothetical protein